MTVTYNAQPVFKDLSWEIHKDRCVGLVGANGTGKSTLLRLIAGELKTESGYANLRGKLSIGSLHQEPRLNPAFTVMEEALTASEKVHELERSLALVETQLGDPTIYGDEKKLTRKLEEHAHLLQEHTRIGGPGYAGQVRATLRNLGFAENELEPSDSSEWRPKEITRTDEIISYPAGYVAAR